MTKKRSKHNRLGIIFAKVDPMVRRRIEKQAASEDISISALVRRAVLRDLEQLRPQEQVRRRFGERPAKSLRFLSAPTGATARARG